MTPRRRAIPSRSGARRSRPCAAIAMRRASAADSSIGRGLLPACAAGTSDTATVAVSDDSRGSVPRNSRKLPTARRLLYPRHMMAFLQSALAFAAIVFPILHVLAVRDDAPPAH